MPDRALEEVGRYATPATIKQHVAANKSVNLVLAFGIRMKPVKKRSSDRADRIDCVAATHARDGFLPFTARPNEHQAALPFPSTPQAQVSAMSRKEFAKPADPSTKPPETQPEIDEQCRNLIQYEQAGQQADGS